MDVGSTQVRARADSESAWAMAGEITNQTP